MYSYYTRTHTVLLATEFAADLPSSATFDYSQTNTLIPVHCLSSSSDFINLCQYHHFITRKIHIPHVNLKNKKNRVHTLLLTTNSRTVRILQDRRNVFPGPSQSPTTFKYKAKQQLLTVCTQSNPMHEVLHQ